MAPLRFVVEFSIVNLSQQNDIMRFVVDFSMSNLPQQIDIMRFVVVFCLVEFARG